MRRCAAEKWSILTSDSLCEQLLQLVARVLTVVSLVPIDGGTSGPNAAVLD